MGNPATIMSNLYREQILDHFRNPRHRGRLKRATHSHEAWNPLCGDKLAFNLNVKNGIVVDIGYEGEGCAISLAAASMLSEVVLGKPVEEINKLTQDDMLALLKIPLTPARLKCGTLALESVKGALVKIKAR